MELYASRRTKIKVVEKNVENEEETSLKVVTNITINYLQELEKVKKMIERVLRQSPNDPIYKVETIYANTKQGRVDFNSWLISYKRNIVSRVKKPDAYYSGTIQLVVQVTIPVKVEKPILTRILSSATQTFLSPNKENKNRSNILSSSASRSGKKSVASSPLKSPQNSTPIQDVTSNTSSGSSSSKRRKSSPTEDALLTLCPQSPTVLGGMGLFASPVHRTNEELPEGDSVTEDADHYTFPDSDEDEEEEEQACFKRHTAISAYRVSMGGANDTLDWKVFV